MPFIDVPTPPQPTLTLQQKQARTAAKLKVLGRQIYQNLKTAYGQGNALINQNSEGLTAEQALAGLGADAAEFGQLVADLKALLNKAKPGTIPDAPAPAPAAGN